MKQLSLPVDEEFLTKATEFFVTKCNEEAYNFLIANYNPNNAPFHRIVLAGQRSSGKSRLARMWFSSTQGLYLDCRVESLDVRVDKSYEKVVIDNFESADEGELLHTINRCFDNKIVTLLVASAKIQLKIPDLQSRINSAYQLQISEPDNDLVLLMIQEMAFINKIRIKANVIDYIKNNLYFPTFTSLLNFKLRVQRLCEDNKMKLDISILRQVYDNK